MSGHAPAGSTAAMSVRRLVALATRDTPAAGVRIAMGRADAAPSRRGPAPPHRGVPGMARCASPQRRGSSPTPASPKACRSSVAFSSRPKRADQRRCQVAGRALPPVRRWRRPPPRANLESRGDRQRDAERDPASPHRKPRRRRRRSAIVGLERGGVGLARRQAIERVGEPVVVVTSKNLTLRWMGTRRGWLSKRRVCRCRTRQSDADGALCCPDWSRGRRARQGQSTAVSSKRERRSAKS